MSLGYGKNFLRLTNKKPTLSTLSGCYLCHYKLRALRVSKEIDWDIPRDYYSHLSSAATQHARKKKKRKKSFKIFWIKKLLIKRLIHLKLTCIFTKFWFCIFQN